MNSPGHQNPQRLHGMQEVRGSNPVSSTATSRARSLLESYGFSLPDSSAGFESCPRKSTSLNSVPLGVRGGSYSNHASVVHRSYGTFKT